MWPRTWTVTSIVIIIIVVVVVVSITVERVLGLVLTNYIVVDAVITPFEILLMIGCNKRNIGKITHVKRESYRRMLYIHATIASKSVAATSYIGNKIDCRTMSGRFECFSSKIIVDVVTIVNVPIFVFVIFVLPASVWRITTATLGVLRQTWK